MLDRTREMYRDLTVALRDRITLLQAGIEKSDCKTVGDDVKHHIRALQTVLDIEASLSLGKRNKAWAAGAGELDLDAARAEIVARLAVWAASR